MGPLIAYVEFVAVVEDLKSLEDQVLICLMVGEHVGLQIVRVHEEEEQETR